MREPYVGHWASATHALECIYFSVIVNIFISGQVTDNGLIVCRVFVPGSLPADCQKRMDWHRQVTNGQVLPSKYGLNATVSHT